MYMSARSPEGLAQDLQMYETGRPRVIPIKLNNSRGN